MDEEQSLREAYEDWLERGTKQPSVHHAWIRHVLHELLGYPAGWLAEGQTISPGIQAVMEELERSIRETLADKEDPQLKLEWTDGETQQRERDIGSLRSRLLELPSELTREVEHLRSRYRDPQPRLFPVAVTFLVPPRAIAALQQGGSH